MIQNQLYWFLELRMSLLRTLKFPEREDGNVDGKRQRYQ